METVRLTVGESSAGIRLDQFLQAELPRYSRSRLQEWIRKGVVLVDGAAQRSSFPVRTGQQIVLTPEPLPSLKASAEDLPLDVLYLDEDVIVVNKPAGMVVHSGAGQHSGTLVNALLHRFGTLSSGTGDDRPGIVHRIDKETSGVLLVARNDFAHRRLAEQFAARTVEKAYLALVQGRVTAEQGSIDSPIARDPVRRTRMTARLGTGRAALTWWTVLERFDRFTWLEVGIGTGRTHQIRVHLASLGHPIAGDTLYGAAPVPASRFFLHAFRLGFHQPTSGVKIIVEAPLPPELVEWLHSVRLTSLK